MGNLGEMLKAAREAKGVSLTEAEEETKIRKRYLEALENEEYDVIPGLVYAKGFLRTYAGFLGLNQEEVNAQFRLLNIVEERQPERRPQVKFQAYTASKRRKKFKWKPSLLTVFLAAAAVITLFVFNSFWNNSGDNAVDPPENNMNQAAQNQPPAGQDLTPDVSRQPAVPDTVYGNTYGQAQNPTAPQNLPGTQLPQPGQQLNLVLTTRDKASWAQVVVDGVQKYSGIMAPGQVMTFNANDKIYIKLGNAGAVEVTYNGQNLGTLGPMGTVAKREFPLVTDSVYSSP